jgi:hypothetical protein
MRKRKRVPLLAAIDMEQTIEAARAIEREAAGEEPNVEHIRALNPRRRRLARRSNRSGDQAPSAAAPISPVGLSVLRSPIAPWGASSVTSESAQLSAWERVS